MSPAAEKQQAHELIDRMAPMQVTAVVRLMEVMVDPFLQALANAPIDDEPVSEEEEREAELARQEFDRGEGIPNEEILAEFGLSQEDFEAMGRTPVDSAAGRS
jgi:hypothetical protein